MLTIALMTGSPALTIWPKSGSPPRANTDEECAAAAQKPTGTVLMMSSFVDLGSACLSGAWKPQSLTGFKPMTHKIKA